MCSFAHRSSDGKVCCSNTITSICCNASTIDNSVLSAHAHPLMTNLNTEREPLSYAEAANQPVWHEAMMKEFEALEANGTWYTYPQSKNPLAISGYIKLNTRPMVLLRDARLDLLSEASLKKRALTMQRHSPYGKNDHHSNSHSHNSQKGLAYASIEC